MKDLKTIVKEYNKIDLMQRKVALATVVSVKGSSYRSPGARMLITDDGKWVGSISGGCLEGDALRKARQVILDQKPMTVTYDTREESNQNLGIGLGCNGVIDVLIEPVDTTQPSNPIMLFSKLVESEKTVALATIFSSDSNNGERILIEEESEVFNHFKNAALAEIVTKDLKTVFSSKISYSKKYIINDQTFEIFLELIQPSISLMIFGGGFDARPVNQLAKTLGWNVTVTDECVAHIAPLFFPDADKLSLCNRDFIDRDFQLTQFTACILMSHNYDYDKAVLRKLINSPTPYIGILGPRKRFDRMVEEFSNENIFLGTEDYHRIHSPIGIDIGAETPDEIAVSIIAEIQSKFTNRSGGYLKYRNAPIHQRDLDSGQIFKQVYINGLEELKEKKFNQS